MLTGVIHWGELDFLITDTPPSQGEEIMALFDYMPSIYGSLLICQPTDFSVADGRRVLDLLRERGLPFLGLVTNMDGVLCPHGEVFHPFLSPMVDVDSLAKEFGVEVLVRIPLAKDITPYINDLADKILRVKPKKLPQRFLVRGAKRWALKKILGA